MGHGTCRSKGLGVSLFSTHTVYDLDTKKLLPAQKQRGGSEANFMKQAECGLNGLQPFKLSTCAYHYILPSSFLITAGLDCYLDACAHAG